MSRLTEQPRAVKGVEDGAEERNEVTTIEKVRFTTQDQRFLKALRIAVDEEV